MIALLAERASTNAQLRQFLLATSIRLTLRFVQIAVHVQMYALYRQSVRNKKKQQIGNAFRDIGRHFLFLVGQDSGYLF